MADTNRSSYYFSCYKIFFPPPPTTLPFPLQFLKNHPLFWLYTEKLASCLPKIHPIPFNFHAIVGSTVQ